MYLFIYASPTKLFVRFHFKIVVVEYYPEITMNHLGYQATLYFMRMYMYMQFYVVFIFFIGSVIEYLMFQSKIGKYELIMKSGERKKEDY